MIHKNRGCDCGHTAYDHDSALICTACDGVALEAADALADEVEKTRRWERGVVIDIPAALDAYRKARGTSEVNPDA